MQLYKAIVLLISNLPAEEKVDKIVLKMPETTRKSRIRILIVEDNEINQQVTLHIINKLGYTGDVAVNGLDALKVLETIPYDLVLMDIQMPELDGFETTRLIRSSSSRVLNRNIPVFAMTAHALKGDYEKCINSGMNGYISKPVQRDELFALIEKHSANYKEINDVNKEDTSEKEIFNEAVLLKRLAGDREFLKELIKKSFDFIPEQIETLKKYHSEDKFDDLKILAHSMKGTFANIEARILNRLAMQLEESLIEQNKPVIDLIIKKIGNEFDKFSHLVKKTLLSD